MFNINSNEIQDLLLTGNFGLEKESLRITPEGNFSKTLHPFPDDEHIVYDFCENQTEINTSIAPSAEEVSDRLLEHTIQIHQTISALPEPELLWPFSNPPYIRNEADIPIARHNVKAEYSEGYREYLADRYGRYKMALCGIHVNYSFSDVLLETGFNMSEQTDFNEYKNQVYLELAEGLAAFGWILTAVTAASPLLDGSYLEKGKAGTTVFNGLGSTRCSELGYWNYFTPIFDYSDIRAYADSIQRYVDDGFIFSPTELYYPIRLKSYGKNNLNRLKEEGVSHIELRMFDLNPLELSGVNVKDLKFAQLLIGWIAGTPRRVFAPRDQVQAAQNFKNAAHYDLKTVKIVTPKGVGYSVVSEALRIIGQMKEFYREHPQEIKDILEFEELKFIDPETRYAWIIRNEFEDKYVERGLSFASELQSRLLKNV